MKSKKTQEQLAEIYRRNIDTVYRICRIYMKNISDAEDATAETFVRMIKSDVMFKSYEHEKAWLIVTAKNICRDMLKSAKRYSEELSDDMLTGIETIDETLIAVKELPEKYRLPIYLHYYEGYSCEEISKMLGCLKSTVGTRLDRGRKMLRKMIEGDENEDKRCNITYKPERRTETENI